MTALIKTIIAAIIGFFMSAENVEKSNITTENSIIKGDNQNHFWNDYTPLKCYQNSEKTRVWLNLSSAS